MFVPQLWVVSFTLWLYTSPYSTAQQQAVAAWLIGYHPGKGIFSDFFKLSRDNNLPPPFHRLLAYFNTNTFVVGLRMLILNSLETIKNIL